MRTSFRRCPPYEGEEPYLYLCFAEQDREAVFPLLEHLYSRGCRMVLFFLSRTALASPNCLSEIRTAVKQGKTVLLLKLEEIPEEALEPRWKKCLEHAVPVEAGETAAERTEHILACQQLTGEYLGTPEDFRIRAATGGGGSIGSTIAMIRLFFLSEGEETLEKLDEIYPAL